MICANILQDRYNKLVGNPTLLALMPNQVAEWYSRLEDFAKRMGPKIQA